MCGIVGYVGAGTDDSAETTLRSMLAAVAHRGPDSEGIERWPNALLGHRRLAIIDLSDAGRQPMLSDDHQVGVVFNGCIYNFQELRLELEQQGCSFHSNCDTEVLVHGYRTWGIDALVPKLRGMFAFGIWDNQLHRLVLVRDRLGVKPLVYTTQNGRLAFASTVTALRAAGLVHDVEPSAVLEFLEFGYVSDDRSIFAGACKLPAATILEWQDGAITQRTYWKLPYPDESSSISFEEATEQTERLLTEAVRLRLYADVPMGALLSGGIDSTLVCWAMKKLNANITAFTVSTPGDVADEAPHTRQTAQILGISHEIVTLPLEQDSLLEDLMNAYGEPFGCSSALAMLQVSKAVKPHATVLLTGDGGDDVFLGYPFQRDYWRAQQVARALPDWAEPVWRRVRPMFDSVPSLRRPKRFLDYATGGLGAITQAHDGLPFYESRGVLGERLLGLQLQQRTIPWSLQSGRKLVTEFLDYQQRMWFVAEFMTKVDGGAMYHALEARSPFLDHVLWEFAARLPVGLRLRGGTLKAVLREIVRKRISPEIASRRKQGFTIPVERWLMNHWSEALEGITRESRLESDGWIQPGALSRLVQQAKTTGHAARQLWFLIVLENWLAKLTLSTDQAIAVNLDQRSPV